jgi:hypothetical protein
MAASLATLKEQHQKALAVIKDRDGAIGDLEKEKQTVGNDLKAANDLVALCRRHNTEFAKITAELIEKYKNKRIKTSLLQAEPFTQIKQVEIEHLIQHYQERIDKERIGSK